MGVGLFGNLRSLKIAGLDVVHSVDPAFVTGRRMDKILLDFACFHLGSKSGFFGLGRPV